MSIIEPLVDRLRPKVAIAENVKGMVTGKAKGYAKAVIRGFREIGYRPQLFLVNAADCGVPQRRERVFFCAIRNDIDAPKLKLAPSMQWVSAGEACEDVQDLTPAEIEDTRARPSDLKWWPLTKKGRSYSEAVKRMEGRTGFFSHIRLDDRSVAPTLTSKENFTHWSQCRQLTLRECKRLGSFPDDYRAKTPRIGKYMIGMSVPPKMAEAVARAVIEQWLTPRYPHG